MAEEKDKNDKKSPMDSWMTGRLLVSMPSMADPRFEKAVIYVCSHTPNGAMGLVINRVYHELDFVALLKQLNIKASTDVTEFPIHFGGPVETGRGFVLHTPDYNREGTTIISDDTSMTATVEILHDISEGKGPRRALLALGYAGWGAGQLEAELQTSGWLVVESDNELVFGEPAETKWTRSMAKIGVSPSMLSVDVGHA